MSVLDESLAEEPDHCEQHEAVVLADKLALFVFLVIIRGKNLMPGSRRLQTMEFRKGIGIINRSYVLTPDQGGLPSRYRDAGAPAELEEHGQKQDSDA